MTSSIKPLLKQNRALTVSSMYFSFFFLILFFPFILFFHSFSIPSFPQLIFFFHLSKDSFFSSTNPFLVSPFDVAFLCVSLSTLRAYFSLFSVFVTWRSDIEKLKVDCMGFSYFSFSSRGLYLFPAISMKFTVPKCFLPFLPNYFAHLLLSCSVLQLLLHLLLLDI